MKIIHTSRLLVIFSVLVSMTLPVSAEETKSKKEPAAKATAAAAASKTKATSSQQATKKVPFYGKVVAATARTLTIKSSENSAERKIAINSQTKIVKDQQPATSKDIVIGRWVGGSVERDADGSETAATINLSAKQKTEKPKAESKPKTASATAPAPAPATSTPKAKEKK